MIRGWKLDPRWREYYERREKERAQVEYRLAYMRIDEERRRMELNDKIEQLKRRPTYAKIV